MSDDEGKVTEEPPPKMSYVFPNGDRYEGECTKTAVGVLMRNGTGKHISANGVVYIGAWHDDRMNGQGTLQHPSGAFYKGEFKNNMFHGMGTYTFADGTKCTGHFHENRLEGEGSFTNTQGLIWTGQFNGKTALGMKMRNDMSKAATHTA